VENDFQEERNVLFRMVMLEPTSAPGHSRKTVQIAHHSAIRLFLSLPAEANIGGFFSLMRSTIESEEGAYKGGQMKPDGGAYGCLHAAFCGSL
jgi:hypothetical protein